MSEITKVGKRYAVVVPKPVRKRVALEEGQRVSVRAEGGRIIIEPLPKDPFADLAKLIPDTYSEAKYERKAEELAKKLARTRH
jgi:AbrB family looped-hinge helix DNA binding protein